MSQQLVAEGWTRTFTQHCKAVPQVTPKPDVHVLSMAAEVLEIKAVLCVVIQPLIWNLLYLAAYTGKFSQD